MTGPTCSRCNGKLYRMEGRHLLRRYPCVARRVSLGVRADVDRVRSLTHSCQRPTRLGSVARTRLFICKASKQADSVTPTSLNIGGLESTKVPGDVRLKVEAAVEASLNRREAGVTVGDVSAAAGVTVSQAETVLNALAYDTQGTLEVSSSGDVVYSLPKNFRSILRNKSLLLRLAPTFKAAQNVGAYVMRVSFGTALVASVAVVWAAVFALLSSQQSDRDDRRGGQIVYHRSPFSTILNLSDLFWYWDPYYYQRQRLRMARGEEMNFFEAIFSFVFGDGDPNDDYEEKRWKLVGQYIQHKGGVVTAEQLAPFLDVPTDNIRSDETMVDEGFMVPALVRFGGSPEVDASGNLLYRFPSLQKTRQQRSAGPPEQGAALERTWDMTKASAGQKVGAVALGLVNVVGITVLTSLLANPVNQYRLAMSSLGFVGGALPLLQGYAFAFFAIPLVRWFLNGRRNAAIEERNAARLAALNAVQRPTPQLAKKLNQAAQEAQRVMIRDRDIIYRTDREATPANELEDFDKRLGLPSRGPSDEAELLKVKDWLGR